MLNIYSISNLILCKTFQIFVHQIYHLSCINKFIIIIKEKQDKMHPQQHDGKAKQPGQLSKIEQMQAKIQQLQAQNKRLKTRIAQMQPHKQKKLRPPNQQKIQQLFQKFEIKRFALKVCYLGFSYDGMAYQKLNDDNTIQAFIFKALHTMSLIKQPTPGDDYTRAGRTDKGVSAMGNVISLKLRSNTPKNPQQLKKHNPHKKIQYCQMLNAILPEDIRILACSQVEQEFNARYWCTRRSYKYFFARNNLDIEAMKVAIKDFVGTHNFINYCKMNLTNTVNFQRTIFSAQIVKSEVNEVFQTNQNQVYYFHFVGNSFLWHQIRFMSSVLFMIGSGQQKPTLVSQLLDLAKFPKKPNYPMAPQYPLILEDCEYPDFKLQTNLKVAAQFYKTFNQLVMRKSTQKILIINCMMMAQKDLLTSARISKQVFMQEYHKINKRVVNKSGKTLSMHKSSGRSFQQAKNSLKGKKLQLFEKKMKKQEQFERKQRQESQLKKQGQNKKQQQVQGQAQGLGQVGDPNEEFE